MRKKKVICMKWEWLFGKRKKGNIGMTEVFVRQKPFNVLKAISENDAVTFDNILKNSDICFAHLQKMLRLYESYGLVTKEITKPEGRRKQNGYTLTEEGRDIFTSLNNIMKMSDGK
jgi:predicted transcriptional regulator